ncbi:MAG: MBL fold metallo-hydrolase [Eubacterium sp.]|nr:MBL fold metallo-hydrolase [Eubacterium sp.]
MKITCLAENTAGRACCGTEHGLSLFIETNGKKILFDTAASGLFAENAEKLGVDLAEADIAILSHGHYDHGGGLETFFRINDHAFVYANRNVFECFMDHERYIGLDQKLYDRPRIRFVDDELQLSEWAELHTFQKKRTVVPILSDGLSVKREGVLVPEQFNHEQYLLIRENGKQILISGCSHKGIINIMNWCEPDVLVGGFHFFRLDMQKEGPELLEKTAEALLQHQTTYYTCHCTGTEQYAFLKERMGERLHYIASGDVVTI